MSSHSKWINILISRENYKCLKALGKFQESFNDIVGRLLKEHEQLPVVTR